MPKKKIEEKAEETTAEKLEAEVEILSPAPLPEESSVDTRVAQIVSLFSEIEQVEGVKFDKDNPKHRLIAAWMVGRGAWLRK